MASQSVNYFKQRLGIEKNELVIGKLTLDLSKCIIQFEDLKKHEKNLSMATVLAAERILRKEEDNVYVKYNDYEFWHILISMLCLMEKFTDVKNATTEYKTYLETGKIVQKNLLASSLPIFTCLSSLISHYLRHVKPNGLLFISYASIPDKMRHIMAKQAERPELDKNGKVRKTKYLREYKRSQGERLEWMPKNKNVCRMFTTKFRSQKEVINSIYFC